MAMWDAVVLGGGPAGMAFGIWAKRTGISALIVDSGPIGGQLHRIFNEIVDYPGIFARDGKAMFAAFYQQFLEMGCEYREHVEIERVDLGRRLVIARQQVLRAKNIVIATGARERRLGVPGEQEMLQRDGYISVSRDRTRFAGKTVAVVGGGDRALEGALQLADAGAHVHWIHRSEQFRAKRSFVERAKSHPRITPHLRCVVTAIQGNGTTESVTMVDAVGRTATFPVSAVFVRIGVQPNNEMVAGQVECDSDGYVIVDDVGRTSMPMVYAIGDICTPPALSCIAGATGQAARTAKWIASQLNSG
jgi:thioredoxin reductase (NADPH)